MLLQSNKQKAECTDISCSLLAFQIFTKCMSVLRLKLSYFPLAFLLVVCICSGTGVTKSQESISFQSNWKIFLLEINCFKVKHFPTWAGACSLQSVTDMHPVHTHLHEEESEELRHSEMHCFIFTRSQKLVTMKRCVQALRVRLTSERQGKTRTCHSRSGASRSRDHCSLLGRHFLLNPCVFFVCWDVSCIASLIFCLYHFSVRVFPKVWGLRMVRAALSALSVV